MDTRTRAFLDREQKRFGSGKIPGHIMRYQDGQSAVIPWQQATYRGRTGTPENRLVAASKTVDMPEWDLPPIERRTPATRLESLSKRLWNQIEADPSMSHSLLKNYQEDLWRSGLPITFEDVKSIAKTLLEKAETDKRTLRKSYNVE